jgi:hypothetical protein
LIAGCRGAEFRGFSRSRQISLKKGSKERAKQIAKRLKIDLNSKKVEIAIALGYTIFLDGNIVFLGAIANIPSS